MLASPPFRPIAATFLFLGVSIFAGADPTLTVHNQTGKPITIRQSLWSFLLDPVGSPRLLDWKCRCLSPGTKATYPLQGHGKDVTSELVIRRLPANGLIHHEGLVIRVAKPSASCPCPPSEPEPEIEMAERLAILGHVGFLVDDRWASRPTRAAGHAAPPQGSRSLVRGSGFPWGDLASFPDGTMAPWLEKEPDAGADPDGPEHP